MICFAKRSSGKKGRKKKKKKETMPCVTRHREKEAGGPLYMVH